ncbi:hypothetical protein CAPTEDRAFT_220509 [Capitella teleta]|uniref:Uncharacterized protein n=1 Tax=Capitella teleta TaxID=283909 RepID=R7TGR7_CAPTE|nr:hypothetical protein CAPTEDRAFT_220509 [Capitella teleta]|eukprot:ELT92993.1 hypothetical protein CAPTEDRAFT_220509 [Capitella teleta]
MRQWREGELPIRERAELRLLPKRIVGSRYLEVLKLWFRMKFIFTISFSWLCSQNASFWGLRWAKRNAYKLREGKFCHSVGTQVPQPFLRNSADIYETTDDGEVTSFTSTGLHVPSLKPSIEAGLREASVQLTASSPMPLTKYPVNLFDLYSALKVKKAAIPCHSVYALNMERISNRLWHPSLEEIEQDSDYVQHCKSRQEMFSQKTLMKT